MALVETSKIIGDAAKPAPGNPKRPRRVKSSAPTRKVGSDLRQETLLDRLAAAYGRTGERPGGGVRRRAATARLHGLNRQRRRGSRGRVTGTTRGDKADIREPANRGQRNGILAPPNQKCSNPALGNSWADHHISSRRRSASSETRPCPHRANCGLACALRQQPT
jgi:hypothetical protein